MDVTRSHISISAAAERLGLKSQRYLNRLCSDGKIEGACQLGRDWLVPVSWVEARKSHKEKRNVQGQQD